LAGKLSVPPLEIFNENWKNKYTIKKLIYSLKMVLLFSCHFQQD
jgi:hypothetical protein